MKADRDHGSSNKKWSRIVLAFSLAKRNILRSKYRSGLIIFGIILTIALETGIVINIDTLYDDFILDNRNKNYTDITVIPTKWANLTSLRKFVKTIQSLPGIAKASPVFTLNSDLILQGKIIDKQILVCGIDSTTHPDYSSLNITSGSRVITGNTALVSDSILKMTGFKINETIASPPEIGFKSMNFTVGGSINDISFFGNNFGFLFVLVDIETLFNAIPEDLRERFLYPEIDVQVENFLDIQQISVNLRDHLGLDYHVWVEKSISQFQITGIKSYQAAMNIVILASFVVEFLFIMNILAISIRDRSREFGILRALGSDTRQLVEIVVTEILIYSIVGSILGLVTGIGFAWVILDVIQNFYPSLVIETIALKPLSLLAIFFSGVIVALISGLYPIFLAISLPVIQNIHSRMRSGQTKYSRYIPTYWKYTIGMGALLAITGFGLQFFVGPSRFLAFEVLSIHFLVILLVFIGTLFVEIGILFFLPRIGFKTLLWFGTVTRTISMRNIAREFQKSLFTIMTATLSLTFIILVGLVSSAVVGGVPEFFENQWGSIDIIAEGQEGNLPTLDSINELDAIDGITRSCLIQEERTVINNDTNSYVFGVNSTKYEPFAEEVIDSFNIDIPAYYWLNQTSYGNHTTHGTHALISHLLQQRLLLPLGTNISLKVGADNHVVNVTISAVIKSNAFLVNGEYLYISTTRFSEFFNSSEAKWFICEVDDKVRKVANHLMSLPQFKDALKIEYFTRAMERSLIFQSALFQALFIESFILAAISQFVCILVSTLRMEREVGILRSIGLPKRGVIGIFLAESTALGIAAAFLGLINGLLGSLLLDWYISLSIPITIQLSVNYIIMWLIFSIFVSQVSSLLPSYRSSRRNIISAVSGRPMAKEYYETINIRQFLRENSSQLQVVFLFLVGVFSCVFIFSNSLNIMGLVPSDSITMIFVFFPNIESINGILTELNIVIAIVGFASIGPISYLMANKTLPDNIGKELVISLLWGLLLGLIAIFCLIFMLVINTSILDFLKIDTILMDINQKFDWLEANLFINFIMGFIGFSFLVIILFELVIFQRIWAFIVIRGFTPQLSLKRKISWVAEKGSKGRKRLIGLLLVYMIIQIILITLNKAITEISNDPYTLYMHPELSLLHPLMFIVTTIIEISFFLLLISLQIVNFQNHSLEMTAIPQKGLSHNN